MNKNYKAHGNWFTTSKRKTTKTSKFMRPNKMPLLSLSLSPSLPLSMFSSLGSKYTIYWWFSDRTSDGFSSLISDWPLGRRVIGQQWSTVWHAFEPDSHSLSKGHLHQKEGQRPQHSLACGCTKSIQVCQVSTNVKSTSFQYFPQVSPSISSIYWHQFKSMFPSGPVAAAVIQQGWSSNFLADYDAVAIKKQKKTQSPYP